MSSFRAASGAELPAEAVSLRLVDTVPAVGHMDPEKQLRRWPDVLRDLPADGFELTPGEARALWLTVQAPSDATPGQYEAQVTLTAEDGTQFPLPVRLVVHQLLLPPPSE